MQYLFTRPWFASQAIFPLCDLPSAMIPKLHPLVYRSRDFCCVHPSFSSCCYSKTCSWEGFLFLLKNYLSPVLQLSPSTKEWAHVSHAPETLMDNVPWTKSLSQDKPSPHYEKMAQCHSVWMNHTTFFLSVTATYVSKERMLPIVPDCTSFSFRSSVIYRTFTRNYQVADLDSVWFSVHEQRQEVKRNSFGNILRNFSWHLRV